MFISASLMMVVVVVIVILIVLVVVAIVVAVEQFVSFRRMRIIPIVVDIFIPISLSSRCCRVSSDYADNGAVIIKIKN